MARPPKATTRPRTSQIGKITRSRNRSKGTLTSSPLTRSPSLHHGLQGHALVGEMVAQGIALRRRVADPEPDLGVPAEIPARQVVPRLRSEAAEERRLEELLPPGP